LHDKDFAVNFTRSDESSHCRHPRQIRGTVSWVLCAARSGPLGVAAWPLAATPVQQGRPRARPSERGLRGGRVGAAGEGTWGVCTGTGTALLVPARLLAPASPLKSVSKKKNNLYFVLLL